MKTRYSWQTEEQEEWSDESRPDQAARPRRDKRLTLLILAVVTIAVFAFIYILFERRLQSREDLVRQNVLAAHQTWEQAVRRNDLELFTNLLARDDSDWFQSQRRLLMADRALSREAFGLALDSSVPITPQVKLDANWRRAELTYPQIYASKSADGSVQTITLGQTQVFQLRGSRWVYSPPSAAFWGDTQTGETSRLEVAFPARDGAIVERLAADLTRDIDAVCVASKADVRSEARECGADWRLPLRFDTDPEALLALGDTTTPVISGRTFVLPAPSLVGIPEDDAGYEALYHGYLDRILATLRNSLELPVPLPDQEIAALCYPSLEAGLRLYIYNPVADIWTEYPSSQRYRFLQPLPDDSGLVLRGGFPGTETGRLQLTLLREGMETALFDEGTTELSARLVDLPERPQSDSLVISSTQGSTGITDYRLLPLASCDDGSCDVNELDGFPVWSPGGIRSLVLVGSALYLGDNMGHPLHLVGRAFSPFWLTEDTFGFVRLSDEASDEGPAMELVIRSAVTEVEHSLIRSADFLQQAKSDQKGALGIKYVTASPVDPNTLFVAATPAVGSNERYYVLKLRIDGDIASLSEDVKLAEVEVILTLDDLPVGDPSILTPTGYPPFTLTDDGHWLMVVRFTDPVTNTWVIDLYDTARGETQTLTLNFPAYPAPFPFYDWSEDGQWLLVVDDGFLRLIAPGHDYERVVTHDFAACRYPAWVNPAVMANVQQ